MGGERRGGEERGKKGGGGGGGGKKKHKAAVSAAARKAMEHIRARRVGPGKKGREEEEGKKERTHSSSCTAPATCALSFFSLAYTSSRGRKGKRGKKEKGIGVLPDSGFLLLPTKTSANSFADFLRHFQRNEARKGGRRKRGKEKVAARTVASAYNLPTSTIFSTSGAVTSDSWWPRGMRKKRGEKGMKLNPQQKEHVSLLLYS